MKFMLKSLIIVLLLGVFNLYGSDKDKKTEAAPKTETVSIDTTSSSPSSSLPKPEQEKKESASKAKKKKKKNKPKLDNEDLILAIFTETVEEVAGLMKKINIEHREERTGCTALAIACSINKRQIVKLLLENNADINTLDKNGNSVLISAILGAENESNHEIVKLLLQKAVNINIKNNQGDTALILATSKGKYKTVELLLAHPDIDINIKNNSGKTALSIASPKIKSLLNKAIADKKTHKDKQVTSPSSSTSSITTSSSSSSPSSSSPKPKEEHPHSKETDTKKKIEIVDRMMQPKIKALEPAYSLFDENPDEFKKVLNDALTELSKLEKALANDSQPEIVEKLKSYRKQIEDLSNPSGLTTSSTDSSRSLTSSSLPSALPSSSEKDNKEEEYQVTSPTSSTSSSTTSLSSLSPSSSLPKPDKGKKESASTAKKKKKKKKAISKSTQTHTHTHTNTNTNELIDAIKNGDFEKVQEALKNGADINAKDKNGDTVLIIACIMEEADRKIVELLLEHGAKVDGKDDKGNTALIRISSFLEYTDIIEILLNHGADAHAQNDQALMNACEFGNIDLIKLLLEKKANVNTQDNIGNTPLINVCCESGLNYSDIVVQLLLEKGADVNIRNIFGDTALISLIQDKEAANYESDILRTVKLLIDAGLDVNAEDNQNNTALYFAEENNLTNIVKLLKDAGAKNKKADKSKANIDLINAILQKNKEKALKLAKSVKINPNYKDKDGSTALIYAAQKGYIEIVKILLEQGADVNIQDNKGHTAQTWALINGHDNITNLVKQCANCTLSYENNLKKLKKCECDKVYCKYIKCAEKFESHKRRCKKHKAKTPSSPSSLPSTKTTVPSTTVEDKIKVEDKESKKPVKIETVQDKEEGKTEKVTPSSPSSLPSTRTTVPSTTVEDKIKVEDKESKERVESETDEDESEEEEWQLVKRKRRKILSILVHGSTGRTKPKNTDEETAMKQVMDNPEKGVKIRITLNDPRWPAHKGWSKMSQIMTINSKRIKIHYVANKNGKYADFKFKD